MTLENKKLTEKQKVCEHKECELINFDTKLIKCSNCGLEGKWLL